MYNNNYISTSTIQINIYIYTYIDLQLKKYIVNVTLTRSKPY